MSVKNIEIAGLRPVKAIVIGASAGGVEALLKIFADLKPGYALPIIVVLHIPDERRSQLASVFEQRLLIPVKEVLDKQPITPGTLYFAAPGYHVSVENDFSFSLSREDRVHHSRPSIDYLLNPQPMCINTHWLRYYSPALIRMVHRG